MTEKIRNNDMPMEKGLSFLDVKLHLLLAYCVGVWSGPFPWAWVSAGVLGLYAPKCTWGTLGLTIGLVWVSDAAVCTSHPHPLTRHFPPHPDVADIAFVLLHKTRASEPFAGHPVIRQLIELRAFIGVLERVCTRTVCL